MLLLNPFYSPKSLSSEGLKGSAGIRLRHYLASQSYLTQFIYSLVLDSQLLHKNVNLIFQIVIVDNRLTIVLKS